MSGMSSSERRGRLPQPYRRPDSPYPLPQIPFRKTFALSSPRRREPYLVNIAVDPKPLIDTECGERFECDFSLDVIPRGGGMFPQTSQAIQGQGPIPFQLDTSEDSDRTLVSGMSDSFGGSERTVMSISGASPDSTPVINEPFYGSQPQMSDHYESSPEPSPIIKGPFYRPQSQISDYFESYYGSSPESSPVIKGPFYRPQTQMSDYYESSPEPSPVIKGPFYRPQSQMSDYFESSPEPSPIIKGQFYRPHSQMSDYYESSPEPSPVIKGPFYRPQSRFYDYYGSSPEQPGTSAHTSREGTREMSISPVIRRRRAGRYNVMPTSTDTPKGILKHLRRRRIPGRRPIPDLPWSPTYLPEDARSPVSGVTSPPPRWIDKSISWEKSDESYGPSDRHW